MTDVISPDTISRWQAGDMGTFEALYRQYERMVFKNAYFITGSREDAEDVLQDVFVSIWRARRDFNPQKARLTTWLYRITVNKCLDRHRKRKLPEVPLEDSGAEDIEDERQAIGTEAEFEELLKALKTLDAKHLAVLVLRYFNDLSYEEIARAAEIPLGTVKSRIYEGLKMLRSRLGSPMENKSEQELKL
jgi:RNA polymerase sigma-70 factor (ECF subfamily)